MPSLLLSKSSATKARTQKQQFFVGALRLVAVLGVIGLMKVDLGLGKGRDCATTSSPNIANDKQREATNKQVISVVSVSCGERFSQVLELVESIASRTRQSPIHHYVFTSQDLVESLATSLAGKHSTSNHDSKFAVEVLPLPAEPPPGTSYDMLFPCASARLFFPEAFQANKRSLPEHLVYIDADAYVTTSLEKLWNLSSTAFAEHPKLTFMMAQETLDGPGLRRYQGSPQIRNIDGVETKIHMIPEKSRGLNSGVMALNMTAWQENKLMERIQKALTFTKAHNLTLEYGDQGVLNYVAAQDDSLWMELPCEWNVRMDTYHTCATRFGEMGGGIYHGSRQILHKKGGERLPTVMIRAILRGS